MEGTLTVCGLAYGLCKVDPSDTSNSNFLIANFENDEPG